MINIQTFTYHTSHFTFDVRNTYMASEWSLEEEAGKFQVAAADPIVGPLQ